MCPSVSGQHYWRTRYNNRDSGVNLDADAFPPAMHNVAPDRWYLYLPRNLSSCEECRHEIEEHVRRRAKLLDDYLHKYHPEMLGSGVFRPIPFENPRKRAGYSPPLNPNVTFFLERLDSTTSNDSTTISDSVGSPEVESASSSEGERNKMHWKAKTMPTLKEEEQSYTKCNRSCLTKKQPYRSIDSWTPGSVHDEECIRRRRTVRFADSIGLELEHIRFIMRPDVPDVSKRSTTVSKSSTFFTSGSACFGSSEHSELHFVPQFTIPRPQLAFSPERGSVYLEHLSLPADSSSGAIFGRVRVENVDFEKQISVRYTINDWKTESEKSAQYQFSYGDGRSDAFSFTLVLSKSQLIPGLRLQFAIRCEFPRIARVHWDSNNNQNYCLLFVNEPFYRSRALHDLLHAL